MKGVSPAAPAAAASLLCCIVPVVGDSSDSIVLVLALPVELPLIPRIWSCRWPPSPSRTHTAAVGAAAALDACVGALCAPRVGVLHALALAEL